MVTDKGDFRDIFSYENLKKEISMIQEMRETIVGQREMIELLGKEVRELRSQFKN